MMQLRKYLSLLCQMSLGLSTLLLIGCRGTPSKSPQLQPMRNMDDQTSYGAQSVNPFFKDGLAARPAVPHAVAEGEEDLIPVDFTSQATPNTPKNENDKRRDKVKLLKESPYPITKESLLIGQKKFDTICAACHDMTGRANGLVTQYAKGSIRPPDFVEKRLLEAPIGEIYDAITYGVNNFNMPAFSYALTQEERWYVATYVRALQLTRYKSARESKASVSSNKAEVGSNKAEVGSNKAEVGSNKAEVSSNKAEAGSNKAEAGKDGNKEEKD
jgi:mono/diheme cytochrome c family protein